MLFFLVALAKRIKSSAKKRCMNEGPSLEVFTPVQFQERSQSLWGQQGTPCIGWIRWKDITLADAPWREERVKFFAIYKNRKVGRVDAWHDKVNPNFWEVEPDEDVMDETPFKSIESFLKVKVDLKRHEATLASGDCHGMHKVHVLVNEITKIESYNATSSSRLLLLLIWGFSIWTK